MGLLFLYFILKKKNVEAGLAGVGVFAFLSALLNKPRPRELTPFQQLSVVEEDIKESQKLADEAVLNTVPNAEKTNKTRRERWKDL